MSTTFSEDRSVRIRKDVRKEGGCPKWYGGTSHSFVGNENFSNFARYYASTACLLHPVFTTTAVEMKFDGYTYAHHGRESIFKGLCKKKPS